MTHLFKPEASAWTTLIRKRKENIGFVSKLGAFKEITEEEKALSLAIEIQSWQASKGTRLPGWKVSESYFDPKGHGINLLRTREPGGKLDGPEWDGAIIAYIQTPMDHYGILKAQGIDVSRYEIKPTIFRKIFCWFQDWLHRNDKEYEPPNRTRLTQEFINQMTFKEKK